MSVTFFCVLSNLGIIQTFEHQFHGGKKKPTRIFSFPPFFCLCKINGNQSGNETNSPSRTSYNVVSGSFGAESDICFYHETKQIHHIFYDVHRPNSSNVCRVQDSEKG